MHPSIGTVLLTSRERSSAASAPTLEGPFAGERDFEVPAIVLALLELVWVAADADEVARKALRLEGALRVPSQGGAR